MELLEERYSPHILRLHYKIDLLILHYEDPVLRIHSFVGDQQYCYTQMWLEIEKVYACQKLNIYQVLRVAVEVVQVDVVMDVEYVVVVVKVKV